MHNQVTTISAIQAELDAFINVLLAHGVDVEKVILFGSFARGTSHRYSDIDLAVVSAQFGRDEIDEMMSIARCAAQVSTRIEAVAVSQKALSAQAYPLMSQIVRSGRVVYQKPVKRGFAVDMILTSHDTRRTPSSARLG